MKSIHVLVQSSTRCYLRSQKMFNSTKMKVAVAMSGGVDSSVAAYILQQKGYDVIGVFMKNWNTSNEKSSNCQLDKDASDVKQVCADLGIECINVSFEKEYWNEVFVPFIDSYKTGIITPNPDVACNRHIKFDCLRNYVTNTLGIEHMATGHYARLEHTKNESGDEDTSLITGIDKNKDQSYFLCQTTGKQLQRVLFPIGDMLKTEVKRIAASRFSGLDVTRKRESMGLCFIGKRNMSDFLGEYISFTPGRFIDIDNGATVGHHDSKELLTIGQCAKISGFPDRYYIVGKHPDTNHIFVGLGKNHPALYYSSLTVSASDMTWIAAKPPLELETNRVMEFNFRSRYRVDCEHPCLVRLQPDGSLVVEFKTPSRAITRGQVIALYDCSYKVCYGGGIITEPGGNYFKEASERGINDINCLV